jgi:hypothetical protein
VARKYQASQLRIRPARQNQNNTYITGVAATLVQPRRDLVRVLRRIVPDRTHRQSAVRQGTSLVGQRPRYGTGERRKETDIGADPLSTSVNEERVEAARSPPDDVTFSPISCNVAERSDDPKSRLTEDRSRSAYKSH